MLRGFRMKMYESNGQGCKRFDNSNNSSESTIENIIPCPDLDYESLRPAPFYELGYTREEIKQGETDLNLRYFTDEDLA